MRRTKVMTAVLGLVLVAACGGGGTAATPTRPAATAAATTGATAAPLATAPAAPTVAPTAIVTSPPVQTPEATAEPVQTLPPEATPAGTAAAVDFCSLLTSDEVAAALSEQVSAPQPDADTCGWIPAAADGTKTLVLEGIDVTDFNDLEGMTVGVTNTHVAGMGDDAFIQTLEAATTTLYIKKGAVAMELIVVAAELSANDIATIETTLGAKAAARL